MDGSVGKAKLRVDGIPEIIVFVVTKCDINFEIGKYRYQRFTECREHRPPRIDIDQPLSRAIDIAGLGDGIKPAFMFEVLVFNTPGPGDRP